LKKSSSEEETDEDGQPLDKNGDVSNTHFIHAPLHSLQGHSDVVVAADWLAGGHKVVTGSWDCSAVVHDVERMVSLDTLCGRFSSGGGRLLSDTAA